MDDQLVKFEHQWRFGNRRKALRIAEEYIAAHEENLKKPPYNLHWYGQEGLVGMIDGYREKGDEGSRIIVDMWLLVKFPKTLNDAYFPESELPQLHLQNPEAMQQFLYEWRQGDRDKAKTIAKEFVEANKLDVLHEYDLEDLCLLCESYRHYSQLGSANVVEMFQLVYYEPQNITGELTVGKPVYVT